MNAAPHILIATPSYPGQVTVPYHISVADAKKILPQVGVSVEETHYPGDGLISRGRMSLLGTFMRNPQYTHIMWIDSDLQFTWEDIVRMIAVDREFVCGVYRKRSEPVSFPCVYLQNPREPFTLDEKGCIQLKRAPGGFCLWKRSMVERLIRAYPERRCMVVDGGWFAEGNECVYDFFPLPVDDSGMYQSEDYGLSDLWRAAGGEIHCLPDIELSHAGYVARMSDYLRFVKEKAA